MVLNGITYTWPHSPRTKMELLTLTTMPIGHSYATFSQPKFVDAGGAIIVNPEAGEIFYRTREEKRKIVEVAVDEIKGKVPVFSG